MRLQVLVVMALLTVLVWATDTDAADAGPIAFTDPAYVALPADPAGPEQAGAEDIQEYLGKAADLEVTIIQGTPNEPLPPDAPRIHVGNTPVARQIIGDMLQREELT